MNASPGCADPVTDAYVDYIAPPYAALALGAPVPVGRLHTAFKRARFLAEAEGVTVLEQEQAIRDAASLAVPQDAGMFMVYLCQ